MALAIAVVLVILFFAGKSQAFMSSNPKTDLIASAIANAEGFYIPGSLPSRANNPGDLKLGDVGNGEINGKTIFASSTDGWTALKKQIELMHSGESAYYAPTDSWRDIAHEWVGTADYVNWMNEVTKILGVTPDSTLEDFYAS